MCYIVTMYFMWFQRLFSTKVTANVLQITRYVYLAAVPVSLLPLFQRNTKILSDHHPCSQIVGTWGLQIIFPKWALKSRYTFWVPANKRHGVATLGSSAPLCYLSPEPKTEVSWRAQDAAQRSQRANLGFMLYSKGTTGAHGEAPLASSWKYVIREPATHSTGHRAASRQASAARTKSHDVRPVSSTWARVHHN